MKRRICVGLVAVTVVLSAFLWGCGDTINQSQPNDLGQISIPSVNIQKVTLYQNPDGSLKGIDIGSLPVFLKDVKSIFFDSGRMGKIKGVLAPDNAARIDGMPNNDSATYYAELQDGKIYRLLTEKFQVITYKPMEYHIGSNGNFNYGKRGSTEMNLNLDAGGKTATIAINFGCDKLFGLKESMEYESGMTVAYVEIGTGNTSSAELLKDVDGNIYATIGGIPLDVPGKMYVIGRKGGLNDKMAEFNFNYTSYPEYIWNAYSSNGESSNMWSVWDSETDTISIHLSTPTP